MERRVSGVATGMVLVVNGEAWWYEREDARYDRLGHRVVPPPASPVRELVTRRKR